MKGKRRSLYLELAKKGEEKMKAQLSKNFQENATNRELGKRGRGRWLQILS